VVIRDIGNDSFFDPKIVFINNEAASHLYDVENLKLKIIKGQDESEETDISLNPLLFMQKCKAERDIFWEEDDYEKILLDSTSSKKGLARESEIFTLKSIKINWINFKNTYMHVFINNTDIYKLEKAKATNK
jgi:hypothetical protein